MDKTKSRKLRKEIARLRGRCSKFELAYKAKKSEIQETNNEISRMLSEISSMTHELAKTEHEESWISVPHVVDMIMNIFEKRQSILTDVELETIDEQIIAYAIHSGEIKNRDEPGILVTYAVNKDGSHLCRPYNKNLDHDLQAYEMFLIPVSEERLFKLNRLDDHDDAS